MRNKTVLTAGVMLANALSAISALPFTL